MRFAAVPGFFLALIVTGCSFSPTVSPSLSQDSGLAIHGKAYGGQQAVAGAHVYLYAAGTGGYGTAVTSLLTSSVATNNPGYYGEDGSSHYYVITDSGGNFSISADYTCTTGTGVYLYAVGGNSGGGANSAIGLMAALGACPVADNFASATFVFMDEVSTIAAAYAMAGFATDATHVSSSNSTLAQTGVQNAFANAANLAGISTGQALDTTPAGNGTVPQTEINTLANILASCINSASSSSTACSTLFSNAMSAGSSGSTATDTATAAIYIAHNPAANIAALYDLGTPTPPFAPALGSQPIDFTIAINFTGGGMNGSDGIAIDGSGNAWAANSDGSVSKFSSTGAVVSGSPFAVDINGNGVLFAPFAIAIDGSSNVWVPNYDGSVSNVTKLTSAGATVAGSPFSGGGLSQPLAIAIDGSSNVWLTNNDGSSSATKLTSAGDGASGSPFTGGGLLALGPTAIAIDGSGNAWFSVGACDCLAKLSNAGTAISGAGDYVSAYATVGDTVAIDGSGNVLVLNYNSFTEFIGAATPVVTPMAANLTSPYSAPASKP